jgi:signal transduction histidine kinase
MRPVNKGLSCIDWVSCLYWQSFISYKGTARESDLEFDQKQWHDELDNLALEEFLSYYSDIRNCDEGFIPAGKRVSPQTLITTYMVKVIQLGAQNCYIAQYSESLQDILYSYHPVTRPMHEKSVELEQLKISGFITQEHQEKIDLYFLIQAEPNEMVYLGIFDLKIRYKSKEFEVCQSYAHNIIQAYLRLKEQDHVTCFRNRIKELETNLSLLAEQHILAETSGRVAHEINNFLMSLNGNLSILSEQLEKSGGDPEMQSRLQRLSAFSEIVAGLTMHMTQNAEPENSTESLDLNGLVQETIDFIRPLEAKRNIKFELELSPLPEIALERARIYQIILNLCNYLLKNRRAMTLVVETLAIGDQIFVRFYPSDLQLPHANDKHAFKNPLYLETDLGISITLELVKEQHGILYSYEDKNNLGFQLTLRESKSI